MAPTSREVHSKVSDLGEDKLQNYEEALFQYLMFLLYNNYFDSSAKMEENLQS